MKIPDDDQNINEKIPPQTLLQQENHKDNGDNVANNNEQIKKHDHIETFDL
jgi:hypothetical protein